MSIKQLHSERVKKKITLICIQLSTTQLSGGIHSSYCRSHLFSYNKGYLVLAQRKRAAGMSSVVELDFNVTQHVILSLSVQESTGIDNILPSTG